MMRAGIDKKSLIFFILMLSFSVFSFGSNRGSLDPPVSELLKIDSIANKAKSNFLSFAEFAYNEINEKEMSFEAFEQGLTGYSNLLKQGKLNRTDTLTIIDFSKPSSEVRLFILDLCNLKLIHKSLCAHGVNSGRLYPKKFSNEQNSRQSSLGFYVTTTTYSGKFDLALRLKGMEYSNSHASSRGVVMHAADYANYDFLEKNGCQLGRSYGCPAVPADKFSEVVEWIKGGTCMFIYYPSRSYKRHSRYLNQKYYLEDFVEV
ncbi:MAG: murein L,D-transpeptidase catalytic domain family protein [Crocinitomicaceae bacterium]